MMWKTKAQTAVFLIVAVVAVNHAKADEVVDGVAYQMCKLVKVNILILLLIIILCIGAIKNLPIELVENITTLIENSISFTCKATFTVSDGENCTTCMTWKHNNSENISDSVILKNNLMRVNSMLYPHSGNYCCSISETDGSGWPSESTGLSECYSVTVIGKNIFINLVL